jgi:hypothetical protein
MTGRRWFQYHNGMMKRLSCAALVMGMVVGSGSAGAAGLGQEQMGPVAAASAQMHNDAATITALLRPSLTNVQQAIDSVNVNRWKGSHDDRDRAEANLNSIQRDLQTTLPPMLASADAAPNAVTALFPVMRNVDALYDVLLRVVERADASAPQQQVAALEQARASLEDGRRALGDRIQSAALMQEQRIGQLQRALDARPAVVAPPVAPAPAPIVRAKPKAKPRPKVKPRPKAKTSSSGASETTTATPNP